MFVSPSPFPANASEAKARAIFDEARDDMLAALVAIHRRDAKRIALMRDVMARKRQMAADMRERGVEAAFMVVLDVNDDALLVRIDKGGRVSYLWNFTTGKARRRA